MSILWLDEIGDADAARVGGKAFALARLKRAGLPVPDGFVWTGGALDDPGGRAALGAAYARLAGAVAVRSSSSAEDLAAASFAGQYRTCLDVTGPAAVASAVESVLESAANGVAYARAMGANSAGAMAVLVQRYVAPRAAGVAFTRHPRDAGSLLVEAHPGRGDALVSGLVTPDSYVIARSGVLREGPEGGCLSPADRDRIVSAALAAERLFGGPQDVEWAWGANGLAILQSRPVTVEADEPALPRRLTRANVGEVLPDPVTPLTWSTLGTFLERAFVDLTRHAGLLRAEPTEAFLVRYQERLYLNLDLCLAVAASIPGIDAGDAARLVLGGGVPEGGGRAVSLRALPRLAATALRLLGLGARLPRAVAESQRELARLPGPGAIADAPPRRLAEWLEEFTAAGRRVAFAHVGTSGASGVRLALLGRLLARVAPGDPTARVNRLMAALDDVASAAPAAALERLAAAIAARSEWKAWLERADAAVEWRAGRAPGGLADEIAAILARFGHRGISEGELRAAAWEDDAAPVFDGLRGLAADPEAARLRRASRADLREADEEALLSRLGPARRALVARALQAARDGIRERERTKSMAVAFMQHGRRLARAAASRLVAARVLADADDVFFLTVAELTAALRGGGAPRALIARRRRRHAAAAGVPAPRDVDRTRDVVVAPAGGHLAGIGVSGGSAVGPARVVTAETPAAVRPGEILVAPVLDAALGPQLAVAAAAIAEIGGMLSHGSVVARELGVPCVVDVREATRRIATGDRLWVDGDTGRVVRLDDEAAEAGVGALSPVLDPAPAERRGLHDLLPHPRARESVYDHAFDPANGVGVVATLGVRPGRGGERLIAVALPDGRTLFGLALGAARADDEGLTVAGVRADWPPVRLRFDGWLAPHEAARFPPGPIPLLMTPPTVRVGLDLHFTPTTPTVDFCAGLPAATLAALAPIGAHHLEQSGRWHGTIAIDGRTMPFTGSGSRDRSWGLRDWSAADHWRLVSARFGDALAVHALAVTVNGVRIEGGFVWREGRCERITRVEHVCERRGGRVVGVTAEVATAHGRPLRIVGRVLGTVTVPVELARSVGRHLAGRPYALLLQENFTRFETDGLTGHGMAEVTERPLP